MRPPLLTRAFLLASLAHFVYALGYNLYLHFPGFLKGLGAGEIEIGVIFGLMGATAIAARPTLGKVMDTRGRRVVVLAGGAINLSVCALYLTVHSLGPWVYLVRVLHGVSEAMLFTSLFALVSDIVPAERRIEGIALFGVSGMLPISFGGLLGDVILRHGSYRALFAASIACALTAFALSLPLRDGPKAETDEPPRGIAAALVQPDFVPLWLAGMAFAIAIAAPFGFVKTFVIDRGIGSVGLYFSAYAVSASVLRIGLGSLPDKFGPTRVLVPAMISGALGLAVLAMAQGALGVAASGVLSGLGHGFTFPILVGLVVARARPQERGAALAVFTALFDAGTLVGGPLFGWLIKVSGYPGAFFAASALMVSGVIGFVVTERRRSDWVEA